ncbi:toll/interleukin-1 receptor domain-containing protein [Methanosphaera sp. BMS]|uniref:toll/interleukin-1 receptor domain-containing protein n=1 Tax=Methanosphaera sp. BMS TaxID=1789762 RepID=UPI000DC1EA75|nr:toll/interleukin-1 receptor domain-containing protein [Methanosphaera sp. BMS]AWX31698.1 hypothetical protein AW729_00725 [Methanosphaera sp. BMS]
MNGDFYELKAKINDYNNIYLEHDIVYTGRGGFLGRLLYGFNDGIVIKKDNITIEGNNHTIDANGKVRIFEIKGKNVTLKNITFKNGYANDFGGAIRNEEGQINLINCKFINNTAKENGNDISNTPESEIKIENCEFSQNNDKYPILNYGKLKIYYEEKDSIQSIAIGGKIEYIKCKTHLNILNVETNKNTNENHYLTVQLLDENNKPIVGKPIELGENHISITNNNGEAIFIHKTDNPGSVLLPIKYDGDFSNYYPSKTLNIELTTKIDKQHINSKDDEKPLNDNTQTHIRKAPFHAYNGEEPFMFVSYSHLDAEEVFKDLKVFNDYGVKIWYDEGIIASSEWPEVISNKIKSCSLFVVFISDNSIESPNVRNEINFALSKKKPFIAIHLEDCELKYGLDLSMVSKQGILKHSLNTYDEYLFACDVAFKSNNFYLFNNK